MIVFFNFFFVKPPVLVESAHVLPQQVGVEVVMVGFAVLIAENKKGILSLICGVCNSSSCNSYKTGV